MFGDRDLASAIAEAEEAVAASETPEQLEAARHRMMLAVDERLRSSSRTRCHLTTASMGGAEARWPSVPQSGPHDVPSGGWRATRT